LSTQIGVFKHDQLNPRHAPEERLVLTLTQPWASLVVLGSKKLETRGWRTNYHGPLLIHAAKNMPKDCRELADTPTFSAALAPWFAIHGRDMALLAEAGISFTTLGASVTPEPIDQLREECAHL
jgi:hypothetical protein